MSRFLFAVPPFAGHVNPTIAVGEELTRRGHDVAWAGHSLAVARLLPAGYPLLPAGDEITLAALEQTHTRWLNLRGYAALKVLWEDVLIPVGRAMLAGLATAVEQFHPDVVVADQQALAGPVIAQRRGIPWATSASTFAELTRPYAAMPAIEAWVEGLLDAFAIAGGLPAAEARRIDLRFSERLVLSYVTPELAGAVKVACSPTFVGPAIGARPHDPGFPWGWLDPDGTARRKRVLVSLGTHNAEAGRKFFGVLLEAVAPLAASVQAIVVAPPGAVAAPGGVPDHVLVTERVPQLRLLRAVDAVISHGGINTVCESLAEGKPLVVAPIRDDQPIIADRVAAVGAGVRVRFGRVTAPELGAAMEAVLDDPSYRAAACGMAAAFARAGGAAAAAEHLEKLA